jgi:hypothetical protein
MLIVEVGQRNCQLLLALGVAHHMTVFNQVLLLISILTIGALGNWLGKSALTMYLRGYLDSA